MFWVLLSAPLAGIAQSRIDPGTIQQKMQWFADAKLGIFIHAGIYSVNGIDESWSPVPGLVYIDVPGTVLDPYVTVLQLKLDGPVRLYRGQGGLN